MVGSKKIFTDEKQFKWLLELEKRRSQRVGGTVCVLQIDFSKISNMNSDKVWEHLLNLIIAITRESDIILACDRKINLVFTNTLKDGAYIACKRIYGLIQKLLSKEENESQNASPVAEVEVYIWDYKDKLMYKTVFFDDESNKELCNPILI